ncbi:MAG: butyrate kinase [Gammaproteobacteria bacterium]|nr:MAG: butyrate kinase [Gammaproteobacteria bacterium]
MSAVIKENKDLQILTINPGSTSTKVTLFKGDTELFSSSVEHSSAELAKFEKISDQFEYRKSIILSAIEKEGINIKEIAAVVGRGGLLKPMSGGTYAICQKMIDDLHLAERGEHASNLGALIAKAISVTIDCPAYIVDPVVVDEMNDIARYSGNPLLPRKSIFHALNQKRTARIVAAKIGKPYESSNIIVAHMGGGISVGVHADGKVVDVNNALDGEGPFTPERSGTVPVGQLVDLCFSAEYEKGSIKKMIKGNGGLTAYLGTNDLREVVRMMDSGNHEAENVFQAMVYQVAKSIGEMATVVCGKLDAIALTGGMAYSERLTQEITKRVGFIAEVIIIPGENEMESLRDGALRVLSGVDKAKEY